MPSWAAWFPPVVGLSSGSSSLAALLVAWQPSASGGGGNMYDRKKAVKAIEDWLEACDPDISGSWDDVVYWASVIVAMRKVIDGKSLNKADREALQSIIDDMQGELDNDPDADPVYWKEQIECLKSAAKK